MRTFDSIGAFVRHMTTIGATLPEAEHRALDKGSEIVLAEVRKIPGTYQPGWAPLASSTIARKAAGDTPLLETGEMRDSYERKVISNERASVGSNDAKAVTHELGNRHVPPRPVLLTAAVRKEGAVRKVVGKTIFHHLGSLPEASGDYSD